ncbi:MAG TPA: hypothetical protein VNQ74_04765 [Burkholderiaceae bacterium]|nr:hypothetical protein [Burkholderiaceae bacterium]
MDNGYALSLNLTLWVGVEMQNMMERHRDLPTFQGNSSWMLPIPATFVVGRDRRSRRASWTLDYPQARRDRGHAGGAQELAHVPEKWEPVFR